MLYVFAMGTQSGVLGAFLTFAPTPWYPAYAARGAAWGFTPLEDQQLAGLIMWVPAGLLYLHVAVFLFMAWLQMEEDWRARAIAALGPCYKSWLAKNDTTPHNGRVRRQLPTRTSLNPSYEVTVIALQGPLVNMLGEKRTGVSVEN